MRLTSLLMAMLILILSCLPCADVDAMPTPSVHSEITKSSQQQHQEHQGKDMCSPFCHCACCSTFSVVNVPLSLPQHVEAVEAPIYASAIPDEVIEISLPVWQPPQLV